MSGHFPSRQINDFFYKKETEQTLVSGHICTNSASPGGRKDIKNSSRDIVKKAELAMGSLKDNEFNIRFNPNLFSPGVKHKNGNKELFKQQCQLVKEASDFLLTVQVPAFIQVHALLNESNPLACPCAVGSVSLPYCSFNCQGI